MVVVDAMWPPSVITKSACFIRGHHTCGLSIYVYALQLDVLHYYEGNMRGAIYSNGE